MAFLGPIGGIAATRVSSPESLPSTQREQQLRRQRTEQARPLKPRVTVHEHGVPRHKVTPDFEPSASTAANDVMPT